MKKILIVIPARYKSSRLPGKPLIKIAGIPMIKRVAQIAEHICKKIDDCNYVVATDDERIENFCYEKDINVTVTATTCRSGTERCFNVVESLTEKPYLIVNLQGDNPLCPPWFIEQVILEGVKDQKGQVFTPCVNLSWEELDELRKVKELTPYSGTTLQISNSGYALTFSKQILPTIRNEAELRRQLDKSPVRRHIGLYAYTYNALENYLKLPPSKYEIPEGLEQMRFIENEIPVKIIEVDYRNRKGMSGIDSEEDIQRAETIIKECGEFDLEL